jgi:hypothetical protein
MIGTVELPSGLLPESTNKWVLAPHANRVFHGHDNGRAEINDLADGIHCHSHGCIMLLRHRGQWPASSVSVLGATVRCLREGLTRR